MYVEKMMGLTQPATLPPSSSSHAAAASQPAAADDGLVKGGEPWGDFPLVLVRQVQTLTQGNYTLRGQLDALRGTQSDMAAMVKRLMQRVSELEMAQARRPCGGDTLGERNTNTGAALYAPHEAALTVLSEQVGLLRRRLDKHSERLKRGDAASLAAVRQGQEQACKKYEEMLAQHKADTAAALRTLEGRSLTTQQTAVEAMQQTVSGLKAAVDELRARQETSESRCTALQEAGAGRDVVVAELQKAIRGTKEGLRRAQAAMEQLGASSDARLERSEAARTACEARQETALRAMEAAQTRAWAQERELREKTCAELRQTFVQADQARRRGEAQVRRAVQALESQAAAREAATGETTQALQAECAAVREMCQTRWAAGEALQEAMRGELSDLSRALAAVQHALGGVDDTTRLTRGLQEVARQCQEMSLQRERDAAAVAALQASAQQLDAHVQELQATREADVEDLRREQRLLGVALREEMQQRWRDATGRQGAQLGDCLDTMMAHLREAEARLQTSLQSEVAAQRRGLEALQGELTSHLQALAARQLAREEQEKQEQAKAAAAQHEERAEAAAAREAALARRCVEQATAETTKALGPRLEQIEAAQRALHGEAARCLTGAARAQDVHELQRRLTALEERTRQVAQETGAVQELQTQWQAALRERTATSEAIQELRQRCQELMRKALQLEQRHTSFAVELHQGDAQVRHVEQTLVHLSADMTGMLERLLRTEESLGPRRSGLQTRLAQVERHVQALQGAPQTNGAVRADDDKSAAGADDDHVGLRQRITALEGGVQQVALRLEQTQAQQRQTERAFAELSQSLTTAVEKVVHGATSASGAAHERHEKEEAQADVTGAGAATAAQAHPAHSPQVEEDGESEGKMTPVTRQLRAVQTAVECLSDTHQSLRRSLAQQQEQLTQLRSELQGCTARMAEWRRGDAAAETRLAAAESTLRQTAVRQDTWETTLQACRNAQDCVQGQLAALEGGVAALTARLQGCEDGLHALASLRATCEAALQSAQELMHHTQRVAADVEAHCYPRAELEERLKNVWLSMTELLARKADKRVMGDELCGEQQQQESTAIAAAAAVVHDVTRQEE